MNRVFVNLAIIALIASLSTAAHAITYGKFCATWRGQFGDGYGGSYLTGAGVSEGDFPAAYAQYKIIRGSTIWDGYLDSTGCVTKQLTSTGTYYFNVYTKASATGSSVGPVTVHVQPQCTDGWTTPNTYVMQGIFSVPLLFPVTLYFTYNQPAMSWASRIMPVFGQSVRKAATLGELGALSGLYTRVSQNTEALCSPNEPYNCDGSYADGLNICLGTGCSALKYCAAHEYGHVVAQYTDGPQRGSYAGDDGAYAAEYLDPALVDGICDSTVVRPTDDPSETHALMAREFIGAAFSEGFAHFVSSAVLNYRWAAAPDFVYYSPVMNSTGNPNAPAPCSGADFCDPPYDVPLGNSSYVTWTEYECDPLGMTTEHFGTEWDWLRFYWSLWTGSPMWDVDEIALMWDQISNNNQASLCCNSVQPPGAPYPPANCTKTNHGTGCSGMFIAEEIVGKLWATGVGTDAAQFGVTDSIWDRVKATYPPGSSMRTRFENVGDYAKVNY